jgi:uncharacterized protein (DUF433 family)
MHVIRQSQVATVDWCNNVGMDNEADLLDFAVYDFPTTDRLLGLYPGTAKRWIDGYTVGGRSYSPIVRESKTNVEDVTWGEFVETRFLGMYRKKHDVPMQRMRPAVERLRELLNVKYPLAHSQPFIGANRELVISVQSELSLENPLKLWVVRSGQYILADPAQQFYDSVQFDDLGGYVTQIWPEDDKIVEINPLKQFGSPVVRAVPTSVLSELMRAGDSIEMIAELYELGQREVEAAMRYELIIAA